MDNNRQFSEEELDQVMFKVNNDVKNEHLADAIFDGGGDVFRNIALGMCYHAISKMIGDNIITEKQGDEIMSGLELYAFNDNTPVTADTGRRYYQNYKKKGVVNEQHLSFL